jgi:hypothetical protein
MYIKLSKYYSNTQFDKITLGRRFIHAPYRTTPSKGSDYGVGPRNRTMLTHRIWFSKKPELQHLTVAECIRQYPRFMIWAYQNLSINWSVYVIREMEELTKRKYVKPAKNQPRLTVLVSL